MLEQTSSEGITKLSLRGRMSFMNERSNLLESISTTIKDYRSGEVPESTPDHVERWVKQFDTDAQIHILREIDHIFKTTYYSKAHFLTFFDEHINKKSDPYDFWRRANILEIQKKGNSQREILNLFDKVLKKQIGISFREMPPSDGPCVYIDDALFTGARIKDDLLPWIEKYDQDIVNLHILVIAVHRLGKWHCGESLKKKARSSGKNLRFKFWSSNEFENRIRYSSHSDVLWPVDIPDDVALKKYLEGGDPFPFVPRKDDGFPFSIFSSEGGRQVLERQFLNAGVKIRSSCSQNLKKFWRPLGFSHFGLGFGSMVVTFRNCPNNCPLALWWGDPKATPGNIMSKWYPLFQRKINTEDGDRDEFPF